VPKVTVIVDYFTSFWRGCFYGLLAVAGCWRSGSDSMLGFHFWKARQPAIQQLLAAEEQGFRRIAGF
jgi:hypothetical protein